MWWGRVCWEYTLNMFFVKNLLFLTCLALISWVILCYFNYISEGRGLSHRRQRFLARRIANKTVENILQCNPRTYLVSFGYFSFMCVFSAIYGMARLIQLIDTYFMANFRYAYNRFLKAKKGRILCAQQRMVEARCNENSGCGILISTSSLASLDMELEHVTATFTFDDYCKVLLALRKDITGMGKRNRFLDQRIIELEHHNLLLMGRSLLLARESRISFVNNIRGGRSNGYGYMNCMNMRDPRLYVLQRRNVIWTYWTQIDANGADGDNIENNDSRHHNRIVSVFEERDQWFPFGQNAFVSNPLFNIFDPVDGNTTTIEFQCDNRGEFTQIWQKYLRMRYNYNAQKGVYERKSISVNGYMNGSFPIAFGAIKHALRTIDPAQIKVDFSPELPQVFESVKPSMALQNKRGLSNPTPIVVTTDDLQIIQGLGHSV